MFSLRLHFPILEIIWSNKPLALIVTKQEQLRVVKIKPLLDEFFVTRWGWFRIKAERALGIFKQKVFLYISWNQQPIDLQAVKELELYMIKTDRVVLEKWMNEQDEKLLDKVEQESEMNLRFETEVVDNKVRVKVDKDGMPIPIPHENHKRILRAIREPINTRIETWLMQYERTEPSGILTGLKEVQKLKELQKKMSGSITTKFPIIIAVVVAFAFIALVTQGGQIIDHLTTGIHCMQTGVGCIGAPVKP